MTASTALPLAGRTVVVTRPREQAADLAAGITALGGTALVLPALEIGPVDDTRALQDAAARLGDFQLAAFVSPNAVHHAWSALGPALAARGGWPAGLLAAAVGESTATALREHGAPRVLVPADRFDSEGLLAMTELWHVAGWQVVIFRGDGGRELLADTLRTRGATVEHVTCYTRRGPADGGRALAEALAAGRIDALTISSSEGLRHLHDLLPADLRGRLAALPTFVPHARIAETAEQLGHHAIILTPPADSGLLRGLSGYNWPQSC
ncbi:uroporphyrinogen III synthase [Oryzomicrobium terrae]|uniref:Uroporphyrinogen-III synthase n=1 Tax=Oryzomicrobium terrae TaxID=1735038 RepID=A0A5C1E560_9RHOO|nr:uroporphyrinogen-III synthase [Oryzomicrobium terrae]QEL64052.1 uroporphyrinogen III synthase [Oryzomicrobium terrae]